MSWKQNNGRNRGHIDGIGHFLEGPPQFVDKATSDLDMNEHNILQLAKITGAIVSTRDPPYNTIAHTELANFLRFSDGSDSTNSAIVNVNTISNSEGKINIRSSTGIDVSGNTNLSGNFTIGHTGSGYDVKFYGDTPGKSISWNETPNTFIVNGTTQLLGNLTASGDISGNNLFATNKITAGGDISGNNIFSNNKITAGGDISGNNLFATNKITAGGDISGNNLFATSKITAGGDISGNNLFATNKITAGGDISGNNIFSNNKITAGGDISGNNLFATSKITAGGDIIAASGTISGGTIISSGNITATSGNITAATGNITAATGTITGGLINSNSDIIANRNINATIGTITGGTITGGTIISTGNITAAAGTISGGTITSSGNITAASGTISGGNITATSGTISGGVIVTNNILFPGIGGIQTVPYIPGSVPGTLKYVIQTTMASPNTAGSGASNITGAFEQQINNSLYLKTNDVIFINVGPFVAFPDNGLNFGLTLQYGAYLRKSTGDNTVLSRIDAEIPIWYTPDITFSTFYILGNMTAPSDGNYNLHAYFTPVYGPSGGLPVKFYYLGVTASVSIMVFNGI